MTRFPAAGGGMQMAYTYVRDGYPADAEEGETLYHVTENRAYVYDGANWIEQTVTDHGELSGVGTSDHHSRYTDSEARSAVQVANSPSSESGTFNVGGSGPGDSQEQVIASSNENAYAVNLYVQEPSGSFTNSDVWFDADTSFGWITVASVSTNHSGGNQRTKTGVYAPNGWRIRAKTDDDRYATSGDFEVSTLI